MPNSWVGQLCARIVLMVLVSGAVIGSAWYVSAGNQPKRGAAPPDLTPAAVPPMGSLQNPNPTTGETKRETRREDRPSAPQKKKRRKEKDKKKEKEQRKEDRRPRKEGEREHGKKRERRERERETP